MALKVPKSASLFKEGYQISEGLDEAVISNINAVEELSKIIKTSYGPQGLNKLIVNHLDQLYLTNDANTIVSNLEVVHPAAKMLLDAAISQKTDFGDSSAFLILFSSALMQSSKKLLRGGIVASELEIGFEKALNFIVNQIEDEKNKIIFKKMQLDKSIFEGDNFDNLSKVIETVISAKIFGNQNSVTELVLKAIKDVFTNSFVRSSNWDVDTIRIVKCLGGSLDDSKLIDGLVFPRHSESKIKSIVPTANEKKSIKVVLFSCPLDLGQSETKATVLLKTSKELSEFSYLEQQHLLEPLQGLLDNGIKAIVTMGSISEIVIEWADRNSILLLRLASKFEFRRLAYLLNATPLTRLGTPYSEELGFCDKIIMDEFGDTIITSFIRQDATMVTILLRGATKSYLDLVERAIDDSISSFKALLRDPRLIVGAGCFEIQLSKLASQLAKKSKGIQAMVIEAFSESLANVTDALVSYYGRQASSIVTSLRAQHNSEDKLSYYGLDLESDPPVSFDAAFNNILEVLAPKLNALKLATNTTITLLSVDQIVMAKKAGGPKVPKPKPDWDED